MHRLICGILGVLLLTSACLGGGWTSWGMFTEADFRPQIDDNDLRIIVKALELSDEERDIVRDLHAAHIGRVRDEGAAVKAECLDLIERTQMLGDGAPIEEVRARREKWTARREEMDTEFLADLRLVLSAEQEARWSIVERELRRMRGMPDGRMLGESIDPIEFITDEEAAQSPEIATILDRYAREVDSALRTREDAVADAEAAGMRELFATDPQKVSRLFEKVRSARIRVRDLNRRAIEDVAARLGPEGSAQLRTRWRDTLAGPLSLDESFAMQILTSAAELGSLTESQRSRITAATDAYIAMRDRWIGDYLKTAMEVEETSIPEELQVALEGGELNTNGRTMSQTKSERSRLEPLHKAWENRVDFEKRARAEAYAVLTPEQRLGLPLMIENAKIRFGDLYATYDYLNP